MFHRHQLKSTGYSKLYSLDSICDLEGGAWRTAGRRTLRCCSLGFWLGTPATEATCLNKSWVYMLTSSCAISISKGLMWSVQVWVQVQPFFFFLVNPVQCNQPTSNTHLNLVLVHVWELVALSEIPQASPLGIQSTRESKKKCSNITKPHKTGTSLLSLHFSNHRAGYHSNPYRAWGLVLQSNSCAVTWQALGPLIYFCLCLSISLALLAWHDLALISAEAEKPRAFV